MTMNEEDGGGDPSQGAPGGEEPRKVKFCGIARHLPFVFTMRGGLITAMDLGDAAATNAGPSAAFSRRN